MTREEIQNIYIRICRDSGWRLSHTSAAILSAKVIGLHPLEIWCQFSDMDVMERIAKGEHPACHQ